ncbi:MAG: hypothetical protein R3Y28_04235 [Candidatus Gastranaerophilales bacterium]
MTVGFLLSVTYLNLLSVLTFGNPSARGAIGFWLEFGGSFGGGLGGRVLVGGGAEKIPLAVELAGFFY